MQFSDIISFSSHMIIKHIKVPLLVYLFLITLDLCYMIQNPLLNTLRGRYQVSVWVMMALTGQGIYLVSIILTSLMFC